MVAKPPLSHTSAEKNFAPGNSGPDHCAWVRPVNFSFNLCFMLRPVNHSLNLCFMLRPVNYSLNLCFMLRPINYSLNLCFMSRLVKGPCITFYLHIDIAKITCIPSPLSTRRCTIRYILFSASLHYFKTTALLLYQCTFAYYNNILNSSYIYSI